MTPEEKEQDRRRLNDLFCKIVDICLAHRWSMIGGVQFDDGNTAISHTRLKTRDADELEKIIKLKLDNRHL